MNFPVPGQLQRAADEVSFVEPMTIRPMQNAGWGRALRTDADAAMAPTHMRDVHPGYNPYRNMRAGYSDTARSLSQSKILTTVLNGVRTSGSTLRTARVSGLGAVDCATFGPSTWKGAQGDALMALVLSNAGLPEVTANLAATGVGPCYVQFIGTVIPSLTPTDTAAGEEIYATLRSVGGLPGLEASVVVPFLAALSRVHGLTPARAVQLFNCGVQVTKSGGWANYGELWSQTACGGPTWYENPLYLGAGAAVLIGAVWFATRKKKRA